VAYPSFGRQQYKQEWYTLVDIGPRLHHPQYQVGGDMMRCCVQCYHAIEDDPNDGFLTTYPKLYLIFLIVVSVLEGEFWVQQGLLMVGLPSSTFCSLAWRLHVRRRIAVAETHLRHSSLDDRSE